MGVRGTASYRRRAARYWGWRKRHDATRPTTRWSTLCAVSASVTAMLSPCGPAGIDGNRGSRFVEIDQRTWNFSGYLTGATERPGRRVGCRYGGGSKGPVARHPGRPEAPDRERRPRLPRHADPHPPLRIPDEQSPLGGHRSKPAGGGGATFGVEALQSCGVALRLGTGSNGRQSRGPCAESRHSRTTTCRFRSSGGVGHACMARRSHRRPLSDRPGADTNLRRPQAFAIRRRPW